MKKLRLAAVSAIYNCATQNETILSKQRLEHIHKYIEDDDIALPMNYIYEQSKDEKRCKELFNPFTITKISNLLLKTTLSETVKIVACTSINNYLERSYTNR